MYPLVRLGCVLVLLAGSALAQQSVTRQDAARPRVPNTLDTLNQTIPDVTFQDTPLEQVMSWLQDLTHLNLQVHWQTLEDAGVKRDKPISVQAHNLRLMQVLWLIMNEAGGSDLKLAYRASGSLLIFSTADDLNREMITKVYDVSDLLVTLPRAQRQSTFDVTQGIEQMGGVGASSGASGGMFQQGGTMQSQGQGYGANGEQDQEKSPKLEKLVNLIQDTIEPDSWRQNGGNGTISVFQKLIIVRNTLLVHQRLGGYLNEDETTQ